jgi:hypothetical protein
LQKSPETNPGTGKVQESLVHEGVALKALGNAAKPVKPGKEALDHPTVAGKFPVGVRPVFEFSVMRSTA